MRGEEKKGNKPNTSILKIILSTLPQDIIMGNCISCAERTSNEVELRVKEEDRRNSGEKLYINDQCIKLYVAID